MDNNGEGSAAWAMVNCLNRLCFPILFSMLSPPLIGRKTGQMRTITSSVINWLNSLGASLEDFPADKDWLELWQNEPEIDEVHITLQEYTAGNGMPSIRLTFDVPRELLEGDELRQCELNGWSSQEFDFSANEDDYLKWLQEETVRIRQWITGKK